MKDMSDFGRYELNQVTYGDSRVLSPDIPGDSIDIIFTDPPYKGKFLYLYEWLANEGARVLKPGGFLCAMAGGYHLDKVFALMSGKGLDWYFKIEVLLPGANSLIWNRRIITQTKPVLLWTKGKGKIEVWQMLDVYKGQGPDKRYHLWGQDVGSARYIIEYILGTGAKALLWEPFAGGGATLEACKILGIDFIASDKDSDAVQACSDRLAGVRRRNNHAQDDFFNLCDEELLAALTGEQT